MADDNKAVIFDDIQQIRIYDPEKFNEAVALQEQAVSFVDKLSIFQNTVTNVVNSVEQQGKQIDQKKLRAIGLRLKVKGEAELRKRKEDELRLRIKEKQIELDRYAAEHNYLRKVEQEQLNLIERLSFTD
ncbi:intraflagellar transport (IFT) protein [Diplonema papillatum]|nr:intraflagellar transport (IFT) protein [Diplonema papillatum]